LGGLFENTGKEEALGPRTLSLADDWTSLWMSYRQALRIPITSAAAIGGISYFGVNSPQFMGLDPLLTTILATTGVAGDFFTATCQILG
jgi:hypothetical protein